MQTFKQFIAEDGGAAAGPSGAIANGGAGTTGNTTSGIANYESPLGSKQPTAEPVRRKKSIEEKLRDLFARRNGLEEGETEVDSQANKIEPVTSRGV